jgi:secondary thiamine-phosphate synthase enzyme
MMVLTQELEFSTRGHADIRDLTEQVEAVVEAAGFQDGLLVLFTPSSTSALTTIEYEQGALDDLRRVLDEIVPPQAEYRHNLRWGDDNGHAHVRAALLGPSLAIPVRSGQMLLGTWQQIVFIDFDVRPRRRRVVVQWVGDTIGESSGRSRTRAKG